MRVSLSLLLVSAAAVAPALAFKAHSNMPRVVRRATPDYQAADPPAYSAEQTTTTTSAASATATNVKRVHLGKPKVLTPSAPTATAPATPKATVPAPTLRAPPAPTTAPLKPAAEYAAPAPATAYGTPATAPGPAPSAMKFAQPAHDQVMPVSKVPANKPARGDVKRSEALALVRRMLEQLEQLGVVTRENIEYKVSPDRDDSTYLHVLDESSPSAPGVPVVSAEEGVKPVA